METGNLKLNKAEYSFAICQRILLPGCLAACIFFRPVGITLIPFILYILNPYVPVCEVRTYKYVKYHVFKATVMLLLIILVQIGFGLFFYRDIVSYESCGFMSKLMRHIGITDVTQLPRKDQALIIFPHLLLFILYLLYYLLTRRIMVLQSIGSEEFMAPSKSSHKLQIKMIRYIPILNFLTEFCLLNLGILRPSFLSMVYFIANIWSWTMRGKKVIETYRYHRRYRFLSYFIIFHIFVLFAYQNPWPQELYPPDSQWPRVLGIPQLIYSNCSTARAFPDIRQLKFQFNLHWTFYMHAVLLLISYPLLVFTYQINEVDFFLTHFRKMKARNRVRHHKPRKHDSNKVLQIGGVPIGLYLTEIGDMFYYLGFVLVNFTLLVWSVIYRTWSTMVFMIAAFLVWILKSPRKLTLTWSNYFLGFAYYILFFSYLFAINMTDDEFSLETDVMVIMANFRELGFKKNIENPYPDLFVFSIFTLLFVANYSNFIREKRHFVSLGMKSFKQFNIKNYKLFSNLRWLQSICNLINNFLGPFFMLFMIILLLACSVSGKYFDVNHYFDFFDIIYMLLFLIPVVTFQVSWFVFKTIMYTFSWIIIFCACVISFMMYTYQFDGAPVYYHESWGLDISWQRTIGLNQMPNEVLLLELARPVIILITVSIQLSIGYEKFYKFMEGEKKFTKNIKLKANASELFRDEFYEPDYDPKTLFDTKTRKLKNNEFTRLKPSVYYTIKKALVTFISIFFHILEKHLVKLILIFAFFIVLADLNVIGGVLGAIAIFALIAPNRLQINFAQMLIIFASILFMFKLVMRMEKFKDMGELSGNWSSEHCGEEPFDVPSWFGFGTTNQEDFIAAGLLMLIVIVTVNTINSIIQRRIRIHKNLPANEPNLLFPEYGRWEAEMNVSSMCKYLVNYWFYRFGIETTCIWMFIIMAVRMDVMSIFYGLFLLLILLLLSRRRRIACIWRFFQLCFLLFLLAQFLIRTTLPPSLCEHFPWYYLWPDYRLEMWANLPTKSENRKQNFIILLDYVLLMLVSQQQKAFWFEKTYDNYVAKMYKGGSNSSIHQNPDYIDFDNPTHNFMISIRNSLDVIKRILLVTPYWGTIFSLLFAGMMNTNIFCLIYFIIAYRLAWEGADFYLRPFNVFVRWWRYLMLFVFFVMFWKSLGHIPGCLYKEAVIEILPEWLLNVGAIYCVHAGYQENKNFTFYDTAAYSSIKIVDDSRYIECICFAFIILQYRIFHSYYFHYICNYQKTTKILMHRGRAIMVTLRILVLGYQEGLIAKHLDKVRTSVSRENDNMMNKFTGNKIGNLEFLDMVYDFKYHDDITVYNVQAICPYSSRLDMNRRIMKMRNVLEVLSEYFKLRPLSPPAEPLPYQKVEEIVCCHCSVCSGSCKSDNYEVNQESWIVWRLLYALIVTVTQINYKATAQLRYVIIMLSLERQEIFRGRDFVAGARLSPDNIWEPMSRYEQLYNRKVELIPGEELYAKSSVIDHNLFTEFLRSLMLVICNYIEDILFLFAFFIVVQEGHLLATPITILIGLWGVLSVPRTSKLFYSVLLIYTMAITFFMLMAQNELVLWKVQPTFTTMNPIKMLGLVQRDHSCTFLFLYIGAIYLFKSLRVNIGMWEDRRFTDELKGVYFSRQENGDKIDVDKMIAKQSNQSDSSDSDEDIETFLHMNKRTISFADAFFGTVAGMRELAHTIKKFGYSMVLIKASGKSVATNNDTLVYIKQTLESVDNYYPAVVLLSFYYYFRELLTFYWRIFMPDDRPKTDVYAYMFLCTFTNFIISIIFFPSFGLSPNHEYYYGSGIRSYLAGSRVPPQFTQLIFIQFVIMFSDRVFYLNRWAKGKFVSHIFCIIYVHYLVFFWVPDYTSRMPNQTIIVRLYFVIWGIYFILSGYQLRLGYPYNISGHWIMFDFRLYNYYGFVCYKLLPGVLELRTIMDWLFTPTALRIDEWFYTDCAIANIFQIKTTRVYDGNYPQRKETATSFQRKSVLGVPILVCILMILWLPLILFAASGTVGRTNNVHSVRLEITIGSFAKIYEQGTMTHNMHQFSETDFQKLITLYFLSREVQTHLDFYDHGDIQVFPLGHKSRDLWLLPPDEIQRFIDELKEEESIDMDITITVYRSTQESEYPVPEELGHTVVLNKTILLELADILETENYGKFIRIPDSLTKFLKIRLEQGVSPLTDALSADSKQKVDKEYPDLMITIQWDDVTNSLYWEIKEDCDHYLYTQLLNRLPHANCEKSIDIYSFNDKIFPTFLQFIAGPGLIGLYATTIYIIAKRVRTNFVGGTTNIIFHQLPCVDRIYCLLQDILLARHVKDFKLERQLYEIFIMLYRSPEALIQWTKACQKFGKRPNEKCCSKVN